MKKFRNWLFKLLTGYDLIEYEEILRYSVHVNKRSEEILDLAASINEDNKRILENNREILETNQKVLDISNKTIKDCRNVLAFCGKESANETMD